MLRKIPFTVGKKPLSVTMNRVQEFNLSPAFWLLLFRVDNLSYQDYSWQQDRELWSTRVNQMTNESQNRSI